jgi:hypothetical protein
VAFKARDQSCDEVLCDNIARRRRKKEKRHTGLSF